MAWLTAIAVLLHYDLAGVAWAGWALLGFSLFATAFHGGQELAGWGYRIRNGESPWWVWWVFLAVQTLFIVLAAWGLPHGISWMLWALAAFKFADAIGFHLVFARSWPGRETWFLPLADAMLLTLWLLR